MTDQPLAGKRILLVEDQLPNKILATKILERQGAEVIAFETHKDRDQFPTDVDAIVTDNDTPESNAGLEWVKEIKSRMSVSPFKDVPVIVVAAAHDLESRAKLAGATASVAKPFNPDELSSAVINAITPPERGVSP